MSFHHVSLLNAHHKKKKKTSLLQITRVTYFGELMGVNIYQRLYLGGGSRGTCKASLWWNTALWPVAHFRHWHFCWPVRFGKNHQFSALEAERLWEPRGGMYIVCMACFLP